MLAAIGLTGSDVFRLMMVRIVTDKAVPFDQFVPNAHTIVHTRHARGGIGTKSDRSAEAMLADLGNEVD